jgi:hypothetical protein
MERNRMAGKRRSAPRGNRQAREHGFYAKVLDAAERVDLELASDVNGIDDEIAVLRVKIKSVLEKDPENLRLIMQATNTLASLVKTRYKISAEQKKGLREAITNVIKDIAIPLGISVGSTAIAKRL